MSSFSFPRVQSGCVSGGLTMIIRSRFLCLSHQTLSVGWEGGRGGNDVFRQGGVCGEENKDKPKTTAGRLGID